MDSNSTDGENVTSENLLQINCRPTWPVWTCTGATVCGLISTTVWFLVLLPQVWKNFRRKSVVGVSALWATANFTASVTNMFFVHLYAKMPLYSKINAIYMPVLEFAMLVQFLVYGEFTRKRKLLYTMFCCVLWSVIIGLQLGLRRFEEMQWVAITLWSIETFPQIMLNIKLQSTSGLSTKSVTITMLGKTTDFIANNVLLLPMQYVIMIYFSSSVAYVNIIQVAWYYKNKTKHTKQLVIQDELLNENVTSDFNHSTELVTKAINNPIQTESNDAIALKTVTNDIKTPKQADENDSKASNEIGNDIKAPEEVGNDIKEPKEIGNDIKAPEEVGNDIKAPEEVGNDIKASKEVGNDINAPKEVGNDIKAPKVVGNDIKQTDTNDMTTPNQTIIDQNDHSAVSDPFLGGKPDFDKAKGSVGIWKRLVSKYRKCCGFFRFFIMGVLSLMFVVFAVGFVWNTGTLFALFGPFWIISVVIGTTVYYEMKRSGMVSIQSVWMTIIH